MPIIKNCRYCKNSFKMKPSHAHKKFYCSKDCMAEDYKTRLKGNNNPNFRSLAKKICINCKNEFESYSKRKKYCTHKCYVSSPEYKNYQNIASHKGVLEIKKRPKKIKIKIIKPRKIRKYAVIKRPSKIPNLTCFHCFKHYHSYNKKRQYCSLSCSYASGSSWRAGMAANEMRKKYGHKKDANHDEIVAIIRKAGIAFYDFSSLGNGIPDGIVWVNNSWQLIEIKNLKTAYGKRGLNKNQKKWISQWNGGPVYILHNIDEAILLIQGKLDKLISFSSKDFIGIMSKI